VFKKPCPVPFSEKKISGDPANSNMVYRQNRQEWMQDVNAHFVASQMVFVDETSKDEQTFHRHYGRLVAGRHAMASANFVQGERYSMVAALSLDGYEAVHVVQGSVDGEEFLDFIVNTVVCCTFYLFRSLLHPLPAAKDEPLPSGQKHPGS